MKKAAVIYLLVFSLMLVSCAPSQGTPSPTAPPAPAATQPATAPSATRIIPTITPTHTPQPTSTGTPVPFSPVISADNLSRLVEVGRIGKGTIRQIAWSPSGDYLALATTIGVYIYSVEPMVAVNFIGAPAGVNAVTYGADDNTLIAAVSTPDHTIKVFNSLTGELLNRLGNQAAIDLSYSQSTNRLLSRFADDTLRLWDMTTGEVIRSFRPAGWLDSAVLSPDGNHVVAGSEVGYYDPRVLELWDGNTGALNRSITGAISGDPDHLAISPNGVYLATAGFNIVVRSLPAGDYLYDGDANDTVMSMIFSSDSMALILGTYEGSIQVWDATSGALERTIPAHGRLVTSLAAQPNGSLVASAADDGWLYLWDAATWTQVGAMGGFESFSHLLLSPDGRLAAVTNWEKVYLWDIDTAELVRELTVATRYVFALAFSPDNAYLAVGSCGTTEEYCPYGAIDLWELDNMTLVKTLYGHTDSIKTLVFSADSQVLASTSYGDDEIKLWDVSSGEVLQSINESITPKFILLSPTGDRLASSIYEGIHLRELPTGNIARIITLGRWWPVRCGFFSADGLTLVTGEDGGEIRWLDSYSGSELFHLDYPFPLPPYSASNPPYVTDLQMLPQGNLLAASYSSGQIAFWDVNSRQMVYSIDLPYSHPTLELTPDGYYLLTNNLDGTIRIWGIAP